LEKIAAPSPTFQRLMLAISRSTIPGLNGIRAVAALLVWWDHYVGQRTRNLGVEIFFVLSGFLITTLLLRELAKTGTVSLAGFYRRRARRIFPAFYVFWVVVAAVTAYHKHPLRTGELASPFFISRIITFLSMLSITALSVIPGRWQWRNSFICYGQCCSCYFETI
jgi:peptidoglycan/LPS O-acetylase OafA/YrhL